MTDATLAYAAMSGNPEILRLVMTGSGNHLTEAAAAEILIQAARQSDLTSLRYVLDSGVSPNSRETQSGRTALISAVEDGRLENTNLLLARGANPNVSDRSGRLALWYAAAATNTGFITLLVQKGADVNTIEGEGQTALMNAAGNCYTWDVETLLRNGADPAVRDARGRTAIDATSTGNDPKCAATRKLLERATASQPNLPRQ